jgi:hypothetical protein
MRCSLKRRFGRYEAARQHERREAKRGIDVLSDLPQRKPAGPMVVHHSDRVLLGAVLHEPLKYPAAIGTEG